MINYSVFGYDSSMETIDLTKEDSNGFIHTHKKVRHRTIRSIHLHVDK